MRPSSSLLGASRLPLTPKRGNKDFYKGTGQAYVPGGGHRTGPPGKHVVRGTAKYRLIDEQVRYYVGPGEEALSASATKGLKPYVSTLVKPILQKSLSIPPFSPLPQPRTPLDQSEVSRAISQKDQTKFSKRYWNLSPDARRREIQEARRRWWEGMVGSYPALGGGAVTTPQEKEVAK